jgi:S-adenosylmethionine-diacylgycerolhomoserine-N-methlytransferase
MADFMSMPGGIPELQTGHFARMDAIYRHQRHIYDLTRRHYLAGRDRLIEGIKAVPGDRILEVGCGTARNLIKIARRYPGTALWGLDASSEMLRSAAHSVQRAGLAKRIALAHGLAEEAPSIFAAQAGFDHVLFSYSLSMIGDWQGAVRAATQVAKAHGQIHLVDFGDLNGLWPPAAAALRSWLRLFHVCPRAELVQRLEQAALHREECSMELLRGRYAFVFKASIGVVSDFAQQVANQH